MQVPVVSPSSVNEPFPTRFSIRDLEEFSGVKAHTIRIWEKRYNLLRPSRTDTNIRTYGQDELKTILNVAYLNGRGYKISKIAAMSPQERSRLVNDLAAQREDHADLLNGLKVAMLNFDEGLFEQISSRFRDEHGFRALAERLFVPLLEQIGALWMAGSICPSQEHFVSNLVRQRFIAETARLPLAPADDAQRTYVLYLPENEIHELGLLYMNYLVRSTGRRSVYLGQGVPQADLLELAGLVKGAVVFVSFITAYPGPEELPAFIQRLREDLPGERFQFWFAGGVVNRLNGTPLPAGVTCFRSIADMVSALG
ncbi:MAG: MerR family transcriptional regulator [Flavobacteriales bacterium]|nr:MerR family transcriptional regulator [Flavobacteriales bacterium]